MNDYAPMLSLEQIRSACARSEPVNLGDPALARFEMPLRETFYPLGFPLQIETNCEEILRSAAATWQGFVKLFDTPPIRLRIGVRNTNSIECPPAPTARIQQHMAAYVADADNYAIVDFSQRFAVIWLTEAAVAHRGYLRHFFLESSVLAILVTSYTTPIHAACIEREGCGILLCGDSGAGKSSLSYACARAGWTFVTDDASYLVNNRQDCLVVGNCNQARFRPSAIELFSELSGKEVIRRAQVGKPSIELDFQPLRSVSLSFTSHVNHVVFLNRQRVSRNELVEFPTEVARFSMLQYLFSAPAVRKLQIAMIDNLLGAGPLELRYHSFEWAIDRLERLADRGH
ncbi:MAG TPA: hypothetical protein VKR52_16525 [Terracidiphilus sp.]|nr:hypothetical protein [Terracidiphilus sp.]